MTIIFDGKKEADKIKANLVERISELEERPKLAIVVNSSDPASVSYVAMKKKTGEELGISVEIFEALAPVNQNDFDGVMVQLPSGEDLSQISPNKDVDGLVSNSDFVPATVKAVEKILDRALLELDTDIDKIKIAVVGAKGSVGKVLVERMGRYSINAGEFDQGDDLGKLIEYDVVISCTGSESLIKPEMIKDQAICIDVGFPKGDFEDSVRAKASFFTPVPGGVGPMTVVCLFENLVNAVDSL